MTRVKCRAIGASMGAAQAHFGGMGTIRSCGLLPAYGSLRTTTARSESKASINVAAPEPAALLLIGLSFGEQFANIHNSIRQFTGMKGGCARLDGASLPPVMILVQDIRIVGQQGFE